MSIVTIVQMLADGHSLLFIQRRLGTTKWHVQNALRTLASGIPAQGNSRQERKERAEMARVWLAVRDWGGEVRRAA